MKIENIKNEFPIFDEKIQNNDLVYLDSANSSQKPKVVADKIMYIMENKDITSMTIDGGFKKWKY